jgi:hypothetical protein
VNPGLTTAAGYAGLDTLAAGGPAGNPAAYVYALPGLLADSAGFSSWLYLQNAGLTCASIEVAFERDGDCTGPQVCGVRTVAPGESTALAAVDCVGPDWLGSATLRSTQPLAIVVDTVGRDTLASAGSGAAGGPGQADPLLFGPWVQDPAGGWDLWVQVHNRSALVPALVQVRLLDAGGATTDTLRDWVCPGGANSGFHFPMSAVQPGLPPRSLVVESLPWREDANSPPVVPPAISGRVWAVRYADPERAEARAAGAYDLLPAGRVLAPAAEHAGALALPMVYRDPNGTTAVTELAVTNLVDETVGGRTDYRLQLSDANGTVATLCDSLPAGASRRLDATRLAGVLPVGFRGGGLISATAWDHPAAGGRGTLGLGAVAVHTWSDPLADGRERLSIDVGQPLAGAPPLNEAPCMPMPP